MFEHVLSHGIGRGIEFRHHLDRLWESKLVDTDVLPTADVVSSGLANEQTGLRFGQIGSVSAARAQVGFFGQTHFEKELLVVPNWQCLDHDIWGQSGIVVCCGPPLRERFLSNGQRHHGSRAGRDRHPPDRHVGRTRVEVGIKT